MVHAMMVGVPVLTIGSTTDHLCAQKRARVKTAWFAPGTVFADFTARRRHVVAHVVGVANPAL